MITLTPEEFTELQSEGGGICFACQERTYGIEPDARRYRCPECNEEQLYGIDELLLMGELDIEFED